MSFSVLNALVSDSVLKSHLCKGAMYIHIIGLLLKAWFTVFKIVRTFLNPEQYKIG